MEDIQSFKRQAAVTRARYDRLAIFYDVMEWFAERAAFQRLRQKLWSHLPGGRILEVGVGTGKNISYYPSGAEVTAIDLSKGMLNQARRNAQSQGIKVDLSQMDAQRLAFPDAYFDAIVATFVFCSAPDPIQGLGELGRVVKPGGDIWLLEHVRINQPVIGLLMDWVNPIVVRLIGANINRQTVENVRIAGLEIVEIQNAHSELIKLIHAHPSIIYETTKER